MVSAYMETDFASKNYILQLVTDGTVSFLLAVALVGNTPFIFPDPHVALEIHECPALPWRPEDGHLARRGTDEWPGGHAI